MGDRWQWVDNVGKVTAFRYVESVKIGQSSSFCLVRNVRFPRESTRKTQNGGLCAIFLLFCYLRLYKSATINVKVLRICRKYCLGKWNCVTLHRSNQEFPGVLYFRKREIDAVGRSRARRCMPFIEYRNDTSLPWFGMSRISPFRDVL